jgi:cell division protein FtsB
MKAVLVILLCVLVLLQVRLWLGPGSITDIARLENEIAEQSEENGQLSARNSVLMDDVSDLRNGLDSIEERARNELGLIRQGETFYLIVDNDPNARQSDAPAEDATRADERLPEPILPEIPPAVPKDDNPYLDIFRDEEGASDQAQVAEPQAPTAGLAAGQ